MKVVLFALMFAFVACDKKKPVEEAVQASAADSPGDSEFGAMGAGAAIGKVYFGFDEYTLSSEAQSQLDSLATQLRGSQGTMIQIEGHCDERGSNEYNLALGKKRAESVKTYLVRSGIDSSRLSTISYGELRPSMEGSNEQAWAMNRRAEFVVTSAQ
jgi:peptidoglycan-associated lipoprotein